MKIVLNTNVLLITIVSSLFIFQNCGVTADSPNEYDNFISQPIYQVSEKFSLDKNTLEHEGTPLFIKNETISQETDYNRKNKYLKKGTKILLTVNNRCVKSDPNTFVRQYTNNFNKTYIDFELDSDILLEEFTQIIEDDSCIILAENNSNTFSTSIFNDRKASSQWYLKAIHHNSTASLTTKSQVLVAVLDTGIDLNHDDLKQNIWRDAQGRAGANLIDHHPTTQDRAGHGTHCAGLIAAQSNNYIGITGVATQNVKIMPVKVLNDEGKGSKASAIRGIEYAIKNGADIISLSLNGAGRSIAMENVLKKATAAGILVFVAAGNNARELVSGSSTGLFLSPASYAKTIKGVISVAALNKNRGRSHFSNFGNSVEFAAPGTDILSTYPYNGYEFLDGTSMATPIAAGAAAIMVSALKDRKLSISAVDLEDYFLEYNGMSPFLSDTTSLGHYLDLKEMISNINNDLPSTKSKLLLKDKSILSVAPLTPAISGCKLSAKISDPDGDGFGWENNKTCIVAMHSSGRPYCRLASHITDPDGDGFGWENNKTCIDR